MSNGIIYLPKSFNADIRAQIQSETEYEQKTTTFFGKVHNVPRLTKWHGSHPYRFGKRTHAPTPFTSNLEGIRQTVQMIAGVEFNAVLQNLYRDGSDSVAWHADDEPEMGPVVASVSFGATRTFKVRHNITREVTKYELGDGDLLVMPAGFQETHQHCITKTKRAVGERLNLTFRQVRSAG